MKPMTPTTGDSRHRWLAGLLLAPLMCAVLPTPAFALRAGMEEKVENELKTALNVPTTAHPVGYAGSASAIHASGPLQGTVVSVPATADQPHAFAMTSEAWNAWLRDHFVAPIIAVHRQRAGIVPPTTPPPTQLTGLEEGNRGVSTVRSDVAVGAAQVQFFKDFVREDRSDTAPSAFREHGLVRAGENRAVVSTTRLPQVRRVFYDARLPRPELMGVDAAALPNDPVEAVAALQQVYKIQPGEMILLPDGEVSVEAARQWRVAGVATPILLVPAAALPGLSTQDLAALATIARALEDQILRVQTETIVRARLDAEFYISAQL